MLLEQTNVKISKESVVLKKQSIYPGCSIMPGCIEFDLPLRGVLAAGGALLALVPFGYISGAS